MRAVDRRFPMVLSFDFEDWNQLLDRRLSLRDWDRRNAAFARQARIVFDLLDTLGVKATFFVLGMTAKNHVDLVREIAHRGHEVATHGFSHRRVYDLDPEAFRADVESSLELLVSATGRTPRGYRAPVFSINRDSLWAYEVLADLGIVYDSSQYNSLRVRRRLKDMPVGPHRLQLPSGRELWELPIAAWGAGPLTLPVGGGSYWRVLPEPLLARALAHVTREGGYTTLYFHPCEFDCDPLGVLLPSSATFRQRVLAGYKEFARNIGRSRIIPLLRAAATRYRFLTHDQALREIETRYSGRARTLSKEGALVRPGL